MDIGVRESGVESGESGQVEACFHCGDRCPQPPVVAEGKPFCCAGCRAVYEILQANDLCRYYDLEQRPGISLRSRAESSGRFAYLEEEGLQQKLLDFADGKLARISLRLPQIHCSSCVWLLENLSRLEEGILESEVDFMRREIALSYDMERLSLRRVVELLASLGYEPEINLDSAGDEAKGKEGRPLPDRGLTQKLAVAGFCFGNVMLFSFPEYLAGPGELAERWSRFFSLMNVLLSLPVLLYSSTEYLASAWHSLRQRAVTIDVPISLGILALYSRSLYEIASGTGSGYMDSFAGLIFFLLIGRLFQRKTFASLSFDRDYRAYFPLAVTVREGEEERTVAVAALEMGQTIAVRNGELVPADSHLLEGECRVDYSYVTGESEPVTRRRGEMVYAGGRIVGNRAELVVTKEVSQSYLTRLWNHEAFRKGKGEELNWMVNRLSRYFTLGVLAIAGLAALYWLRSDAGLALNAFTSVLIIACPCALALATPFAAGTAVNLLAKTGLYLKNTGVVERLARVDCAVFDKTGTLTSTRDTAVEFAGERLAEHGEALRGLLRNSMHPLSRQVLAGMPAGGEGPVEGYREEPGRGLSGRVDGRAVVVGSRDWLVENGLEEGELPEAPVGTAVFAAVDGSCLGYWRLGNAYRPGIGALFAGLRGRFELFLLSGDNDRERERLLPLFGTGERMYFDRSPTDKLAFVEGLQGRGHRVMMVGDGLNDAGALRQSEVGIAVAEGAFSPACDGILDADRLTDLPVFLKLVRACRGVVATSFGLSILYNVVGLGFAVQGSLSPLLSAVLMPLSSVSVIAFTTASVHLLARRLGVER